jgi:hypothetical protein
LFNVLLYELKWTGKDMESSPDNIHPHINTNRKAPARAMCRNEDRNGGLKSRTLSLDIHSVNYPSKGRYVNAYTDAANKDGPFKFVYKQQMLYK